MLLLLFVTAAGASAAEDPIPTDPAASPESPVVAIVNGEAVVAEDVERHLSRIHGSASERLPGGQDLEQLMFKVVNDALIGQEARVLGMDEEPPIPERVKDFRQDRALMRLQKEEILDRAQPTEEEALRLFEEQYRRVSFRVVTAYELAEAEELYRLLEDGADMAVVAKERSVDPYRLRGGLVQSLPRIDLQRGIAGLLFSLEPGQLGGPVQTDLGWSIVRVESFAEADEERFPDLERSLRALVRQRKAIAAAERFSQQLRERIPVEVDDEVVSSIAPERRPDARLVPKIPDPEAVVARVGEHRIITAADYGQALLRRWKGVRNEVAARAASPIVLQKLIEQQLLMAEALARGYHELPEVIRESRAYETELLITLYLEEVVAAGIEVTDDEKRAYYDERKSEFSRPPRVRLGQITVESREEAEKIADHLRDGADLAWLAMQHSTDGYKNAGGDRGWYVPVPGQKDFNQQLFEAGVGAVLDPFGALDTWIVLKVTDREEQGPYPFDEISGNIRGAVFDQKLVVALDDLITKLRERSEIEIHEDVLSSLNITGRVDQGSEEGGTDSGHGH
jgi:parvulin-like peptidyl-prolyl isomerase